MEPEEEFDLGDLGDLTGLSIPPDESEENEWWEPSTEAIPLSAQILPALGLDELEKDRYGFHVVGGYNAGENLAEAFGEEETLLIDAERFNPDFFTHQVDVLSKGGKVPVRVILQNLGEVRPEGVYELEKLFERKNGYPVKSIWLVDDGTEVERSLRHKVLMRCDRIVDADTLLDAVAFGWGSPNAYNGKPAEEPGPDDLYGSDDDVIPSDVPLFGKKALIRKEGYSS
jgi:hypothetical protein